VSQFWLLNPQSMSAPHRMSTLIREQWRCVSTFFGIVSGALAATVLHGTRPALSSVMILSVIS
jgi:hypothetical protein